MGEVLSFRKKRLSGFIPDPEAETLQSDRAYAKHNGAEPIYDDRACSEINPDEAQSLDL